MGELTAELDQSLSGWDIWFLVPFWPEPEPDIKIWPDIRPTGTGYPVHPYSIQITGTAARRSMPCAALLSYMVHPRCISAITRDPNDAI